MKIFEFYCDIGLTNSWVCAPNRQKAEEFYLKITGNHFIEDFKVAELNKSEWDKSYIIDLNESEPDPEDANYERLYPDGHNDGDYFDGYKIKMTFAEYMEKYPNQTNIIATNEY